MSYARFGWDGSSVYLFEHVGGGLECCACSIDRSQVSVRFRDVVEFLRHLDAHEEAGDTVPDTVVPDVLAHYDADEYAWDATADPARLDAWRNRPAPQHEGEGVVEYLERNRHMLGDRADEILADYRQRHAPAGGGS